MSHFPASSDNVVTDSQPNTMGICDSRLTEVGLKDVPQRKEKDGGRGEEGGRGRRTKRRQVATLQDSRILRWYSIVLDVVNSCRHI